MSVFLMGCYDADRDCWVTVTKVHSGHDDATLKKLQNELDMVKIGKDTNLVPSWLRVNKPMVPDFIAKDPKVYVHMQYRRNDREFSLPSNDEFVEATGLGNCWSGIY